jgi:hypothetical protein
MQGGVTNAGAGAHDDRRAIVLADGPDVFGRARSAVG